jgi:hypothetical protein
VQFHFTPTRASWLNQIEIWFSILADQSLATRSLNCAPISTLSSRAIMTPPSRSHGPNPRFTTSGLKARFAEQ